MICICSMFGLLVDCFDLFWWLMMLCWFGIWFSVLYLVFCACVDLWFGFCVSVCLFVLLFVNLICGFCLVFAFDYWFLV